jgi:hypothetical protein
MEVFDGEDLVYSSPQVRVQATDGPGRSNGGMIAGIVLTVIILIAVIVVVVVVMHIRNLACFIGIY